MPHAPTRWLSSVVCSASTRAWSMGQHHHTPGVRAWTALPSRPGLLPGMPGQRRTAGSRLAAVRSSRPPGARTPMATTRGLGPLTLALGLARRRRPPRRSRLRQGRGGHTLRCTLRRGPQDLSASGAIFGAPGVGCDALYQHLSLFGTQRHCLETLKQCAVSKHGGLPRSEDTSPGVRCRGLMERIKEDKSSALIGRTRMSSWLAGRT